MTRPPSPATPSPTDEIVWSQYAEMAPYGIFVVDDTGHYVWVNERACAITGFSRNELLGRHLSEITPADHRPQGAEHFRGVVAGESHPIELPFVRADGSKGWMRLSVGPAGQGRHVAFAEDVTQRKETEASLARETALRRLLLKISGTYLELDPADLNRAIDTSLREIGELLGADRAYVFSYRFDEGVTTNTHEWCAPGIAPQIEALQALPLSEIPTFVAAHSAGRRWEAGCVAEIDHAPLREILEAQDIRSIVTIPLVSEGDCLGFVGLDSVHRERRFTEADVDLLTTFAGMLVSVMRRSEAEKALRESEARFRSMCDDFTHVAIQGYAPDGTVQYWNRGSELLYGYSRDEALGRNLVDLIIPDEMKEGVEEAMGQMARTAEPIPSAELRLQRKDGSRVDVYASYWIVRGHTARQELFCVDIDLTAIRESEERRAALEERLEQRHRLESVGRLAGGVAHDFNNMLNVILGHAELALEEVEPASALVGHLAEVKDAALRSAALTGQLLTFARRQPIVPRILNFDASLRRSGRMLRRLVREDIALEVIGGRDVPDVMMDPTQFDQIVTNLVVNAQDALDGAGRIRVETGHAEVVQSDRTRPAEAAPGSYATLSVVDDGPGIAPEDLEHLFEPFYTTKRQGEGTGLGLAAVYGAVRQIGGFIEVQSTPGEGARFTVFVPASAAAPDPTASGATQAATAPPASATILVVEDEPSVLQLAARALERAGHTVLAAGTATRALELVRDHGEAIDLLLTDVVMPEMDGPELAERVAGLAPGVRVLFMSGYPDRVMAAEGGGVRVGDVLPKPFSVAQLRDRVVDVLAD
jgi:PAS domain S-box-containing protein